jgi:hypothetical protein
MMQPHILLHKLVCSAYNVLKGGKKREKRKMTENAKNLCNTMIPYVAILQNTDQSHRKQYIKAPF